MSALNNGSSGIHVRSSGSGQAKRLNYFFPNSTSPQRFEISVKQDFLDLTLRKVRDYRPSPGLFSDWTIEGPPEDRIAGLAKHWAKKYRWKDVEKKLNRDHEHYAVTVPGSSNYTAGIPLHFIHKRSKDSNAIPILMLHGWTSTYLEWSNAIEKLGQGGNQSFHIVAADLPGFGFSPLATQPGLGPKEMAAAFDTLMHKLGYDTYGIATTDLGFIVGMWMVQGFRDNIIGHFTDYYFVPLDEADLARQARGETTEEENTYIETFNEWFSKHALYISANTQKPQLISTALTDSPVSWSAWLWDLKHACSDGYPYTNDEIITETMTSWIQSPYGGTRGYQQILAAGTVFPKTDLPTGVTQWGGINGPFPPIAEFNLAPRDWVERTANVVYFKRYAFGGHFPAINHPDIWAQDLQSFFASL
ncbi:hypothetical protein LCI18_014984 [Fusarium solani-melongenae]|uniref:Uncharacterized protein n=1 Tax=Fusarium solani subsp. cucurbitae TaxID=2747967 RepID=A0ACD3ZRQ6_FUSSC|nr:hypothetical protein LCI18_014984 [Fusarium solani-melongenae]